ncbi:hypothetical protein SRB5_15810 [Streptomyces sp. RB5]|uniref:Siphovirus-type tail component C-terminal domain-containing protein n=1 Tax=Streptomyces smaragdinus TaxID=2585196 RepID=A0A7K0CDN4_9ACTN|nr:phage tail family protein [Streptomyces smaragdinus]MQY11463.1 hypothetical protein [Streptomyces smaragdinus]
MAALDEDMQLEVAGVLMGPGTCYPIADITGLGVPDMRTQDVDLPTDDGAFAGADYLMPRQVQMEVGIRTPGDPAAATDALAALNEAASDTGVRLAAGQSAVLRALWPGRGQARRLYGRFRVVEVITMQHVRYGWIPLRLEFVATDPSWHDDVEQSLSLPLAIATTQLGFRAPITPPITTGVVDPEARSRWATNRGNLPAWPSLTLLGPVVNPRIMCPQIGQTIALNYTLPAGQRLQIDTRPGTRWVLRNGASAAYALTSSSRLDLFRLPIGSFEMTWMGSEYTNATRLTVAWRDAYTAL